MCGIGGFWTKGKSMWQAPEILPQLIYHTQARGRDACGMFAQHQDEEKHVRWMKMAGQADHFLNWKRPHQEIIKDADEMRFAVFHLRSATVGDAKDDKAAHPHVTKNITLVHNGTLTGGFDKTLPSDSAQIAHWLEEDGDFLNVSDKIWGAYALVWHDKRDDSLNFCRNSARPLGFVEDSSGGIWFASETKMVEWVLDRCNRPGKGTTQLDPFVWVKMTPDGKVNKVNVPLAGKKWTSEVTTEWEQAIGIFDLKEQARIYQSISHGGNKLKFEECTADWNEEIYPPKKSSMSMIPSVKPSSESQASGGSSPGKTFVTLTAWGGLRKGTSLMYFPLVGNEDPTTKRVVLTGPLAEWTGSKPGEPWVEFVDGVEVKGIPDDNWPAHIPNPTFEDRMNAVRAQETLHSAVVRNIIFDLRRKKVVVWCSESSDESSWFTLAESGSSIQLARSAMATSYSPNSYDFEGLTSEGFELIFGEEASVEVLVPEKKPNPQGQEQSELPVTVGPGNGIAKGDVSDIFVPVGSPFSKKCSVCNHVVDDVHKSDLFQYHCKYHVGVQPVVKGLGNPIETKLSAHEGQAEQRFEVCYDCQPAFLGFYNQSADITLTGKVGYALEGLASVGKQFRSGQEVREEPLKPESVTDVDLTGRESGPTNVYETFIFDLAKDDCPNCGLDNWLSTRGATVTCVHCKSAWEVCRDGNILDLFLREVA